MRVEMTTPQLAEAAESWRVSMAPLYERRTGPHKVALEDDLAPWSTVSALQPGMSPGPSRDRFVRTPEGWRFSERRFDLAFLRG